MYGCKPLNSSSLSSLEADTDLSLNLEEAVAQDPFHKITLTDYNRERSKLADHFTGKYLLVDFSVPNCTPCARFSKTTVQQDKIKQILSSKTCSFVTIVNDRFSLPDWLKFVDYAGVERAYSASYQDSNALSPGLSKYPTLIVFDRNGMKVGNSIELFESLCLEKREEG
jgi:thioredoxin-related protein